MRHVFAAYPEVVANTMRIAERGDMSLDVSGLHLPNFPMPKVYDSASYFEKVPRGLKRADGLPGRALQRVTV
jgi:DNA polymerase III subunit alpha